VALDAPPETFTFALWEGCRFRQHGLEHVVDFDTDMAGRMARTIVAVGTDPARARRR